MLIEKLERCNVICTVRKKIMIINVLTFSLSPISALSCCFLAELCKRVKMYQSLSLYSLSINSLHNKNMVITQTCLCNMLQYFMAIK